LFFNLLFTLKEFEGCLNNLIDLSFCHSIMTSYALALTFTPSFYKSLTPYDQLCIQKHSRRCCKNIYYGIARIINECYIKAVTKTPLLNGSCLVYPETWAQSVVDHLSKEYSSFFMYFDKDIEVSIRNLLGDLTREFRRLRPYPFLITNQMNDMFMLRHQFTIEIGNYLNNCLILLNDFNKFHHKMEAAYIIQKQWRKCISNPSYLMCYKRLMREAQLLCI
jgi:hypothetical protein